MHDLLIAGISVAASALISGIISFLVKHSLNKYFEDREKKEKKREEEQAELERLKSEQKESELIRKIKAAVKEETDPILDKLTKIENGTLDTLRDRILSAYYKCLDKGYRTQYDFENVHHLYNDYTELHGNSFVEDCMKKFDAIPSEEELKAQKKAKKSQSKSKKKVLLEDR